MRYMARSQGGVPLVARSNQNQPREHQVTWTDWMVVLAVVGKESPETAYHYLTYRSRGRNASHQ